MKAYLGTDDVLRSPWGNYRFEPEEKAATDYVFRSTKLERSIYEDLRGRDQVLDQIEQSASGMLPTFPVLSQDIFQSFYSLMPRKNDVDSLSTAARKFHAPILDHVMENEDYRTIKTICEGKELPAYEAASEFIERTAGELEELLEKLGGDKNALNTLEKLEQSGKKARQNLADLLEQFRRSKEENPTLERAVVAAANQAESKRRQVEAVDKMISASTAKNKDAVSCAIAGALKAAAEKAGEVREILGVWGNDAGTMERSEVNAELLSMVRSSEVLKDITKYLGRFREILARGKRNSYAYGRGEKYSLELGRDLSRAITSELSMLAAPETVPLFLRKYQQGRIKQYQRREPIYKGSGDIICCLDESTSTEGACAQWGKAVALTLLEIAEGGGRSFALIHFSGPGRFQTDLFRPGSYTPQDKMRAAETFLDGGTDFRTPMEEALRLMREDGFENADIVFITDGECKLPAEYTEYLCQQQALRRFSVTGVLLDEGSAGTDFSLKAFCKNIYRTSELLGDKIVEELVNRRV